VPTNYPNGGNNGLDEFIEPLSPETTPLSQAGGGNYTHAQSHTNMGDAIEALQVNAALRTHDHSGNPASPVDRAKGFRLAQVNTHESVDTDTSVSSIHHTIGPGATQAAAGNHTHEYTAILNTPLRMCTSTSRPVGVPAGTMIYETDTNRVRAWAQFAAANVAVSGVDATDDFNRVNSANMGSGWSQIYTPGSFGVMATPDGNNLSWTDSGGDPARCIARRINPSDMRTQTDDQIIIWRTGGFQQEYYTPFFGATGPSNDFYFRMSDDALSYLRLVSTYNEWGQGSLTLYGTKTGPGGEQRIGSISANTYQINTFWIAELVGDTLSVSYGPNLTGSTVPVGKIVDNNAVTNKGPSYRGWGVGMVAGNRQGLDAIGFGQVTPANISLVTIKDAIYYVGRPLWQLLTVASVPVVRLRQSQAQQINTAGTFIQWGEELEDNFGYYSPLSPSSITIAEPGLYHLNVALQWNSQGVGEEGTVVACINGVETDLRNSAYQKIGTTTAAAGFSQTLTLSGKIRLAANDVLSVKAKHSSPNFIAQILSFFDAASKVNSRLDLVYVSP
jgi:hypothetical protein